MQRKSKVRLAISAAVMATLGSQHKAAAASYYWIGDHDLNWNTSAGFGGTNWSKQSDQNIDPGTLPGSADDVLFYSPGAVNAPLNTTLGQNFSIKSLTFLSQNNQPVTISGNTLTLGSGGITVFGQNATNQINSAVVLGANQTWTNFNSNGAALTLSGVVSGTGSLSIAGVGPVTFTNANTMSGGLAVSTAGNVTTFNGSGSALNLSSLNILGGGTLLLDNSAGTVNRIADNLAVSSSGGIITLNNGSETVGTLQISSGNSQINANNGSTLTFGSASIPSLSRSSGGTVNFAPDGSSTINLPNVTLSNGIIGGWATIGDTTGNSGQLDFATVSGGAVTKLTNYQSDFSATTNNTQMSGTINLANASTTVNSLYLTGNAMLTFGTGIGSTNLLIVGSGGIISNGATGTQGISNQPLLQNIALIGSSARVNNNVAGINLSGKITSGGPDLIVTTASNLQINSIITDNGTNSIGLTKNGSGLLDLSDGNNQAQTVGGKIQNTYTGVTTINGGTLLINDDRNLGAIPTFSNAASIVLNGGILSTTAGFTFNPNRGITVGPQGGTLQYIGGSNWTIQQKITGPGGVTFSALPGGLTGNNIDTITLSSPANSNTYLGSTILNAQKGANAASAIIIWGVDQQIPDNSAVTVTGNPGSGGINLNGHSETIGSLAGGPQSVIYGINASLTMGQNGQSTEYDGVFRGNANGVITKTGGGTLTLIGDSSGTNGFLGTTVVSGGTLLNQGLLAGKAINVTSGGALGGNGFYFAPVTVSAGGALAPALNATTPTTTNLFNNLTINSGGILNFLFDSPGSNDQIGVFSGTNGPSNVILSAGSDVLNIRNTSNFGIGTYALITANGTASFTNLASFVINGSTAFNYAIVSTNGIGGGIDLVVTAGFPTLAWSGAVDNKWNTTTHNWSPTSALWADGDNAIFDDSGHNTSIVLQGNFAPNSITFSNTASVPYSFSGGSITTGGSLTMTSPGAVTFNNAVSVGVATISSGTMTIGSTGSLVSPALTVASGSVLNVNGSLGQATVLQNDGSTTLSTSGGASFTALNGAGSLTLNTPSLTLVGGGFTGTIAGSGSIVENDGGVGATLSLNNSASSYTGSTTLVAGTLIATGNVPVSAPSSLGNSATAVSVGSATSTNAATFLLAGPSTMSRDIVIPAGASNVSLGNSTGDAAVFAGNVGINTANGVTLIGNSSGSVTYSNVSGIGGVTAVSGNSVLTGSLSYTGATLVNGGNLNIAGTLNSSSSLNAVAGTGTVSGSATFAVPVNITGTGTIVDNGTLNAPVINVGNGSTNGLATMVFGTGSTGFSNQVNVNGSAFVQINSTNQAQADLLTGAINLSNSGGVILLEQQIAAGNPLVSVFDGRINVGNSQGSNGADGILQVRDVNGVSTVPGVGLFTNVHIANGGGLNVGLAPSAATPRAHIVTDLFLDGTSAYFSGNADTSSPNYIRNVTSTNAGSTLFIFSNNSTNVLNSNAPLGAKSINFVGALNPNLTVINNINPGAGINLKSETNVASSFSLNGATFETDTGGKTNLQVGATPGTSGTFLVNGGTFAADISADATVTYNGGTINWHSNQNLVALNLNNNYSTILPTDQSANPTGTNSTYSVLPINFNIGQLSVAGTAVVTLNGFNNGTSVVNLASTNASTALSPLATITAGTTVNNGTLNAFGTMTASFGNVMGATGILNLGDGTAVASVNVTGLAQTNVTLASGSSLSVGAGTNGSQIPMAITGTLSVADGTRVTVLPNPTASVTHVVNTLNLNTTGNLDLANHSLLTSTPAATIRSYLIAGGAATGTWNGTSGISSTSAALDATHGRALGYATAGDPAAASLGLTAGQTLVKSTIYGDADLNGRVQIADFNILSANFRINNGSQTWDHGDFNYNGSVTIQDYNLLSAQFGKRVTAGSPNVASASSASLTASPSVTAGPGHPAAGTLEFDVDGITGHITLIANQAAISSYDLESSANNANGDFTRANWTKIATLSGTLSSANQSYELDQEAPAGSTVTLDGSYDLGAVLPAGLTPAQYLADLTDPTGLGNGPSSYGIASGATVNAPVFVNVPEPTCLALAGLVGAGLLGRKRRKASM